MDGREESSYGLNLKKEILRLGLGIWEPLILLFSFGYKKVKLH